MIRFSKYILIGLLASSYLVASFGTLIYQVAMPCISTGYEKVEAAKSSPRDQSTQVGHSDVTCRW